MLEEVGERYQVRLLSPERGEQKAPDHRALNPMGMVPTLVHHGVPITEVAAICCYLADSFPRAGLAPAVGPRARDRRLVLRRARADDGPRAGARLPDGGHRCRQRLGGVALLFSGATLPGGSRRDCKTESGRGRRVGAPRTQLIAPGRALHPSVGPFSLLGCTSQVLIYI